MFWDIWKKCIKCTNGQRRIRTDGRTVIHWSLQLLYCLWWIAWWIKTHWCYTHLQKKEKFYKRNYRPVIILTNISKVYEKLMYIQLSNFFDSLLAPNQCGFRKSFSSQYCLLVMQEKFKEEIDRGNQFGTLLTDLSKAFDCIDCKLPIEKLYEYGVSVSSLNTISCTWNTEHSQPKLMATLVLDRILDTLFHKSWVHYFLILIWLTYFMNAKKNDITNYADDTTPYSHATDIPSVISEI